MMTWVTTNLSFQCASWTKRTGDLAQVMSMRMVLNLWSENRWRCQLLYVARDYVVKTLLVKDCCFSSRRSKLSRIQHLYNKCSLTQPPFNNYLKPHHFFHLPVDSFVIQGFFSFLAALGFTPVETEVSEVTVYEIEFRSSSFYETEFILSGSERRLFMFCSYLLRLCSRLVKNFKVKLNDNWLTAEQIN